MNQTFTLAAAKVRIPPDLHVLPRLDDGQGWVRCKREGVSPEESVYVGDSVARDMMMAKETGVQAVWAKYGTRSSKADYSALVRVTHWTAEDVEREKKLKEVSAGVDPDYVLENSFSDILKCFEL